MAQTRSHSYLGQKLHLKTREDEKSTEVQSKILSTKCEINFAKNIGFFCKKLMP